MKAWEKQRKKFDRIFLLWKRLDLEKVIKISAREQSKRKRKGRKKQQEYLLISCCQISRWLASNPVSTGETRYRVLKGSNTVGFAGNQMRFPDKTMKFAWDQRAARETWSRRQRSRFGGRFLIDIRMIRLHPTSE